MTELNASTGAVVQTIGVGGLPYGVSSDGTHVWVANTGDNTVTELKASTGAVVQTIPVGREPHAISSDATHVWVANFDDNTVSELSASTGAVVQTINVGNGPLGVSSDGTHAWVANLYDSTVTEIAVTNGPLQIATTSLPDAMVGQPYSFQLQATGGTPPYTWNKYLPKGRGALPPRLSLSKGGLISGTPKKAGTYTIIVKCLQATAHPNKTLATQVLTLTVNP